MVLISGAFENLRSKHVRLLHEASRLGPLHVLLWSDEKFRRITGAGPKFPCGNIRELVRDLERAGFVDRGG